WGRPGQASIGVREGQTRRDAWPRVARDEARHDLVGREGRAILAGEVTPMGYVERHLLPNSRVVYKTRLHWILFPRPATLTVRGAVFTGLLWRVEQVPWLWCLGAAVVAGGLVWGLVHYVELMTSEFAVTSTRLIFKVGLVARYTTELLLAKVESIAVTQGLLGRMLNYGDLTVTGTGGAREGFARVHHPVGLRHQGQRAPRTPSGA